MRVFELILLIVLITFTGYAFASSFTTTTGKGYYIWNGQIISYYSTFPNSNINLVDGITAIDTSSNPNATINQQAFNSYICNRQGSSC